MVNDTHTRRRRRSTDSDDDDNCDDVVGPSTEKQHDGIKQKSVPDPNGYRSPFRHALFRQAPFRHAPVSLTLTLTLALTLPVPHVDLGAGLLQYADNRPTLENIH